MSQYFSKIHRGFLIQQTDRGWIVPQMPNWSNGPVNQGPFSTMAIACHVLDRCLDVKESQSTPATSSTKKEVKQEVESYSDDGIDYKYVEWRSILAYVVVFGGIFAFMDLLSHQHPIRFLVVSSIVILAIRMMNKRA